MRDKIANSIATHQMAINELQHIKERLKDSFDENIKLTVESKRAIWTDIFTQRDKFTLSKRTMNLILDEAIKKQRDRINVLIDMEVDREIEKRKSK